MKGLQSHRLKKSTGCPREVVFSDLWEKESSANLLKHLIEVPCSENDMERSFYNGGWGWYKKPLGDLQERDEIMAATVVQWLGSPVGWSFLNEAIEKCGYRLVPKEDERRK